MTSNICAKSHLLAPNQSHICTQSQNTNYFIEIVDNTAVATYAPCVTLEMSFCASVGPVPGRRGNLALAISKVERFGTKTPGGSKMRRCESTTYANENGTVVPFSIHVWPSFFDIQDLAAMPAQGFIKRK
jgi:hypothetical protein